VDNRHDSRKLTTRPLRRLVVSDTVPPQGRGLSCSADRAGYATTMRQKCRRREIARVRAVPSCAPSQPKANAFTAFLAVQLLQPAHEQRGGRRDRVTLRCALLA
jgi:hypothetical protein